MFSDLELNKNYEVIKIAVIIAIILGLATSVFFLAIQKGSYSALYLVPGSIIYNHDDNTVLYVYGVTSSENHQMTYTIETYANDKLVNTKQFSLNSGETLEERVNTVLPADEQYPEKVTLVLKTGSTSESVHFWITNPTL